LRRNIAAAALALSPLALAPVAISQAGGAKPVKKTVRVGDNFFAPDKLNVPTGSKITWRWPSQAGDTHDVKLRSGPKGVKRFHSELAASEYRYSRTLKTPGKYRIICTIHQGMDMTIRVTR
jgi:plastocyanin